MALVRLRSKSAVGSEETGARLFDPAQPDRPERRDPQGYRRGLAVPRLIAGIDTPEVANP
jgi:hypothetical protein